MEPRRPGAGPTFRGCRHRLRTVPLVIGIDLGTTGTKVALYDPDIGVVADAGRPVELHSPAPGHAEAEPAQWWDNVCALIPSTLAAAGAVPADVVAVSSSGMVPAVVAMGEDGPVRRAILQNDARAVTELRELGESLTHLDLVSLTGSSLSQQSVGPTLRWLARHEPGPWASTKVVLGSYDWMLIALGAAPHVEMNWAIESGLFDLDGRPISEVVTTCGADGLIPRVVRSGAVVGEISADASEATTVLKGTPLVVGGADHVLSAVGAGLTQPGDLLVKLGGAGDIMLVSDSPSTDPRLYLDTYPVPGLWMPNGCMATSGSLIRWVQTLVGGVDLDTLDREAEACPPGEIVCLPYFLGEKSPLHDPDLRGAFVGLHLGHDRGALHRSVLEAIAFGFRHHLEVFSELGHSISTTRVTNGGSRSTVWKQIIADVLGTPMIPVVDHPGASLGAALAASIGLGLIDTWSNAVGGARRGVEIAFSPESHLHYSEVYGHWLSVGDALAPMSHALASLSRT